MISIEIGLYFCRRGSSDFPLLNPGLAGCHSIAAQLPRFGDLVRDEMVP